MNNYAGLLLLVSVLLTGCATIPDALKGTSATPQQDLVRVNSAPQIYIGQEARFGGKVVALTTPGSGLTRLEIAVQPLDSTARPIPQAAVIGRIYADYQGFIDPVNVLNQWVTVVGPIQGSEEGRIGQAAYRFVVIRVNRWQRWRAVQQIILPPQPAIPWYWDGPRHFGHHGYYPGLNPWYGEGMMPAQVRTILTE